MTNMWLGVPAQALCDQHLVSTHAECHQELGTIKHHPHGEAVVQGHVDAGQVDLNQLHNRHQNIVLEMEHRGMNHDSPLGDLPDNINEELLQDNADPVHNHRKLRAKNCECVGSSI